MSKVTKNFTLDYPIWEKLKKESNMSQLISNLLEEHFAKSKDMDILRKKVDELDEIIAINSDKRYEFLKIIQEVEKKESKISKYPEEIRNCIKNNDVDKLIISSSEYDFSIEELMETLSVYHAE